MPSFDGTGPRGQGAMIGGGRGYCAVNVMTAGATPVAGRRFLGRGGGGRGHRNCFSATGLTGWMRAQRGMRAFGVSNPAPTKDEELAMLKRQADYLNEELNATQARVQDLEGKQEETK